MSVSHCVRFFRMQRTKGISDTDIVKLNIPTAVPLVYTFDQDLNVLDKRYIGDPAVIEAKINKVANQGKAK